MEPTNEEIVEFANVFNNIYPNADIFKWERFALLNSYSILRYKVKRPFNNTIVSITLRSKLRQHTFTIETDKA